MPGLLTDFRRETTKMVEAARLVTEDDIEEYGFGSGCRKKKFG